MEGSASESKRQAVLKAAEAIGEDILRGKQIGDLDLKTVQAVCNWLLDYKAKVLANEDYMYAQEVEDKYQDLMQYKAQLQYQDTRIQTLEELQSKLNRAIEELHTTEERHKVVEKKFIEDRERAINDLKNEHQRELEAFDSTHTDEDIPPKFKKFSAHYLNIRKKEQFMVSSKRYVEANNMKVEADAEELREIENQKSKWRQHVKQLRDTLLKEQTHQLHCLELKWNKNHSDLLKNFSDEIDKCQKAIAAAEARIAIAQPTGMVPKASKTRNSGAILVPKANDQQKITRMRLTNYSKKREKEISTVMQQRTRSPKRI